MVAAWSDEWPDGDLLNDPVNVAIDCLLLIFIVASSIPQISRLQSSESLVGISPFYLLFNMFFANMSLSLHVINVAETYPNRREAVGKRIRNGELQGLEAFGSTLGLLQVFVYWCSCVAIITLATARLARDPAVNTGRVLGPRSLGSLGFMHAAIFLFPAIKIWRSGVPKPWHPLVFFVGWMREFGTWFNLFFLLTQFVPQALQLWASHGDAGALSLISLALTGVAQILLGIRWVQRLSYPDWFARPFWGTWGTYFFGHYALDHLVQGIAPLLLAIAYMVLSRWDGFHKVGDDESIDIASE